MGICGYDERDGRLALDLHGSSEETTSPRPPVDDTHVGPRRICPAPSRTCTNRRAGRALGCGES